MKLNRKEQIEAVCTAISLGIFDYQRNAALQNSYSNVDGVERAASRMVFLEYLAKYFNGQLAKVQPDEHSWQYVLEEIAILAGANVRSAVQYSAYDKGTNDKPAGGSSSGEGTSEG